MMRRDIELAVDAGLDVLRVHGHIAPRPTLRRGRRARDAVDAGLPAAVGVRQERARPGGRPGAGRGRPARPPSRRSCSGPRTTTRRRWRSASKATRARSRLRYIAAPPAAVVEQDDPRPLGEAVVREGRPDPAVHPPLRRAPPPPAARRHRQPLLLRVVPRRRPRPRPPGGADPAPVPVPVGVRRPGGAGDGRLHRSGAVARPRLGHARRAARPAEVGVRPARAARPVRHVRRVATRHAGVPSGAVAPPHRVDAPAEVPPGGRLRPVLVQRPRPGGVVQRARPRARPEARLRRRAAAPARP